MISKEDIFWIKKAIKLTNFAEKEGEIPVGAILVFKKEIFIESWNKSIKLFDPTAHAEILVIRKLCKKIKNYRTYDTTLYVTLEPCIMCIGAIINARISRLVYGASCNKKYFEKLTLSNFLNKKKINNLKLTKNVLENKCIKKIKDFFIKKRNL